jgi:hypothetical protein
MSHNRLALTVPLLTQDVHNRNSGRHVIMFSIETGIEIDWLVPCAPAKENPDGYKLTAYR